MTGFPKKERHFLFLFPAWIAHHSDGRSRGPDPALGVELAEECQRFPNLLGDAGLRQVAVLRMQGYSVDTVADRVGYAPRSVKRKLQLIRSIREREGSHEQH